VRGEFISDSSQDLSIVWGGFIYGEV